MTQLLSDRIRAPDLDGAAGWLIRVAELATGRVSTLLLLGLP